MTYIVTHNTKEYYNLETEDFNMETEDFNTFNEAKTRFIRLIDELTNMPNCEAWNSENMGDNDELNEDLCCGLCGMCSTVLENDEAEIDNDHNFILHFTNDQHIIYVRKIIQNNTQLP